MLEGKCEENRVPKDVELTPQKKNEQERNKENEKGTQRNGELKKNEKNER